MNWATKRRFIYAITSFIVFIIVILFVYRHFFFPQPTCFDAKMNGFETGVDCGGVCSLRCSNEVSPLVVMWSRALKTNNTSGLYDLVAMISNKNIDNAPQAVSYTFTVYGKNDAILVQKEGSTKVPVNSDFPIIIQNVSLSDVPYRVSVDITDTNHYRTSEKPTDPTLRVLSTRFENGSIPRLYVSLVNTKVIKLKNVPVRVVLFDSLGNAIGAGERVFETIDNEESKNFVLTWNVPFTEDPAQIKVYPIMDPFVVTP